MKLLRDIRKKPAHVRERYAVGIAGSVTAVVALIWTVALPSSPEESARRIAEEEQTVRPFAGLVEGVRNQFATNREIIEQSAAAYRDEVEQGGVAASATGSPATTPQDATSEPIELTPESIAAAQERARATATAAATAVSASSATPMVSGAQTSNGDVDAARAAGDSAVSQPSAGVRSTELPRVSERRTVLIATTSAAREDADSTR